MPSFEKILSGGDLRSIGKSNAAVSKIKNQNDFDGLFQCLYNGDRRVVMRAADAIEKITVTNPFYLANHKRNILKLCHSANNKELMWHLALLLPRLKLTDVELGKAWTMLSGWATDRSNSRIVRVNSLQALFELNGQQPDLTQDLLLTMKHLELENIPSLAARIRILRKQLMKR